MSGPGRSAEWSPPPTEAVLKAEAFKNIDKNHTDNNLKTQFQELVNIWSACEMIIFNGHCSLLNSQLSH